MKKIIRTVTAFGAAALIAASATVGAFAADIKTDEVIFRYDGMNYTLFNAQGERLLYSFGGSVGFSMVTAAVDENENTISISDMTVDEENFSVSGNYELQGVNFERTYTIRPNSVSGDRDTLEVKVVATNTDTVEHQVGSRTFFDTMVENNDKAPFRIAGVGAVTTQMQFEGENIPLSFQAFSSLNSNRLIGTGSFATGSGAPDIVQFNSFGNACGSNLIPWITIGEEIGDSSVSAIWNYRALQPGESFVTRAFYGLGSIDVSKDSDLVLGATKIDANFEVNEEGTGYNPVNFTSYITNSGLVDLTNVEMSIDVPYGVNVIGDSSVSYDSLTIGAERQKTWQINAVPAPEERTVQIVISAKSTETGEVTPITFTYTVPAIEGAPEPTPEPTTEEPTTIAEPDTQAATSATDAATKDEATKSEATKESANGTVKTGEAVPAFAILAVLTAAVGAVYILRRRAK